MGVVVDALQVRKSRCCGCWHLHTLADDGVVPVFAAPPAFDRARSHLHVAPPAICRVRSHLCFSNLDGVLWRQLRFRSPSAPSSGRDGRLSFLPRCFTPPRNWRASISSTCTNLSRGSVRHSVSRLGGSWDLRLSWESDTAETRGRCLWLRVRFVFSGGERACLRSFLCFQVAAVP